MFGISYTPPIEVIRNNKVILEKGSEWTQEFTVVTVLGSNHFNNLINDSENEAESRKEHFVRPFKFCIDLFGSLSLFTGTNQSQTEVERDQEQTSLIDGFFNAQDSILFLHLNDSYDGHILTDSCDELNSVLLEKEFVPDYNSFKSKYCQSLLLLFSLSHFIILSSSYSYFETRFIHLFKTLDSIRTKTKSYTSKLLNGLDFDLPKQWVEHCRLCSPKLLFFFEIESTTPVTPVRYVNARISESNNCLIDYRKSLEDEIKLLLKKCRIITNTSTNSLFELSETSDFVFIYDKSTADAGCENNMSTFSNYIQQFCASLSSVKRENLASPSSSINSTSKLLLSKPEGLLQKDYRNAFRDFLIGNIKLMHKKVYENNDTTRRRAEPKMYYCILPTWKQWKRVFETLFDYLIMGNHSDPRGVEAYMGFQQFVNVDSEYLEAQCAKLLPKAIARYQKNIPEVYAEDEHRSRLGQAINVYLNISRGATIVSWLEKLAAKCEHYWKNGHQQCPALSLFEHCCVRPLHRMPAQGHLEIVPFPLAFGDLELPELSHSSGATMRSSCNCGRSQVTRDEPFTIREANYSFYKRVESGCCEELEEYKFPVYAPSQEDSAAQISLQDMLTIIQQKCKKLTLGGQENTGDNLIDNEDDFDLNASQELRRGNSLIDEEEFDSALKTDNFPNGDEISLSQVYCPDVLMSTARDYISEETNSGQEISNLKSVELAENISKSNASPDIQEPFSRLEYLPGMLHSRSPAGLLPLFPSFSLVCQGSSSIYAHNSGIVHQQGFFTGFLHLLLPYDVKVKAEAGVSKPIPRVYRGTRIFNQMKRLSDEFSVKLFIGVEFECKKGHRFFLETPDKVLMIPNNVDRVPNLKESASKIANSDIPLYYKCPCSAGGRDIRPNIAQLMRIHIVTPKAPVHVSINPRILPGPVPCPIFTPGNTDPIKLRPSSYWVLRLPLSYVDDEKCYVPPQDPTTYNGRLLRGFYEVVAMSRSETKEWENDNTIT